MNWNERFKIGSQNTSCDSLISRRAIVDELKSATDPITLPESLDAAPDLAQSSAYRSPGTITT